MNTRWTISELSAQTAIALTELNVGQESGRVSEAPSSRTIRFYTTHGLLDRPLEFKGRTALYGERHLLQLVAIKQLQAKGRALAEIQSAVVGASDDALRKISGLSDSVEPSAKPKKQKEAKKEDAFWKRSVERQPMRSDVTAESDELTGPFEDLPEVKIHPALELAPGVMLVLENAEILDSDLDAIYAAAEPLVALLQKRRIVRPKP